MRTLHRAKSVARSLAYISRVSQLHRFTSVYITMSGCAVITRYELWIMYPRVVSNFLPVRFALPLAENSPHCSRAIVNINFGRTLNWYKLRRARQLNPLVVGSYISWTNRRVSSSFHYSPENTLVEPRLRFGEIFDERWEVRDIGEI